MGFALSAGGAGSGKTCDCRANCCPATCSDWRDIKGISMPTRFRSHLVTLALTVLAGILLIDSGHSAGAADRESIVRDVAVAQGKYATVESWLVRRKQLREAFLKGAGLWPLPARTPLNPATHSRRERDGYSVENVTIETFPGF